jgi:hypothetical protein
MKFMKIYGVHTIILRRFRFTRCRVLYLQSCYALIKIHVLYVVGFPYKTTLLEVLQEGAVQ